MQNFNTECECDIFQMSRFKVVIIIIISSPRGHAFRKEFSNLGEIRGIVPESVNLMALTATAIASTRNFTIKNLGMRNPAIVYVPPFKGNIIYFVLDNQRKASMKHFDLL